MYMIIDMLAAETVVTAALRTVSEFLFGVVGVGDSADRAFVAVGFVFEFTAGFLRRLLEVYRLRGGSRFKRAEVCQQVIAAENEEVKQSYERDQG